MSWMKRQFTPTSSPVRTWGVGFGAPSALVLMVLMERVPLKEKRRSCLAFCCLFKFVVGLVVGSVCDYSCLLVALSSGDISLSLSLSRSLQQLFMGCGLIVMKRTRRFELDGQRSHYHCHEQDHNTKNTTRFGFSRKRSPQELRCELDTAS